MRHKMNPIRLMGLWGVLLLAGCSLNRGAPPAQQYVLGHRPLPESAAAPRDLGNLAIGMRRLQLAAYLDSPLIVVRQGSQEIRLSDFQRWGEPLGEGINRAVASYLAAGATFRVVDVAPWPPRAEHDYLIELHVLRFEGEAPPEESSTAEGAARMLATWAVVRPDGEVLARGTTDYRQGGWRVGDYPGLVALLDAGVYALAADLRSRLESLAEQ
jgi:uncharacterized lipoprotein YmbA